MHLGPKNLEKLRDKVGGKQMGIIYIFLAVNTMEVDEIAQEEGIGWKGKSAVKFFYDLCWVQMPVYHLILQNSVVKEGKLIVIFLFREYTVTLRMNILE